MKYLRLLPESSATFLVLSTGDLCCFLASELVLFLPGLLLFGDFPPLIFGDPGPTFLELPLAALAEYLTNVWSLESRSFKALVPWAMAKHTLYFDSLARCRYRLSLPKIPRVFLPYAIFLPKYSKGSISEELHERFPFRSLTSSSARLTTQRVKRLHTHRLTQTLSDSFQSHKNCSIYLSIYRTGTRTWPLQN